MRSLVNHVRDGVCRIRLETLKNVNIFEIVYSLSVFFPTSFNTEALSKKIYIFKVFLCSPATLRLSTFLFYILIILQIEVHDNKLQHQNS